MVPPVPYPRAVLAVHFKVLDGAAVVERSDAQFIEGSDGQIRSVMNLDAKEDYDLQRTTGSLVRVGPNDLVTDDPDVLRKIMATRSAYTRGPWYDAMRFDPGRDNLLSTRDEKAHIKLRNKMAAGVGYLTTNISLADFVNSTPEKRTSLWNRQSTPRLVTLWS